KKADEYFLDPDDEDSFYDPADYQPEDDIPVDDSKSNDKNVKFKERVLPPNTMHTLDDSSLVGVSKEAPSPDKDAAPSKSGALRGAKSGGGSANTQSIFPKHRGTVQRYFDRK
ncbi:MAG: hypothetical protein AAF488_16885, partial [Planctomycetota bacterium]